MSISIRRATSLLLLTAIGAVGILGENLHLLGGGHHGECHCAAPSHHDGCVHEPSHEHEPTHAATAEHGTRASLSVSCDACPVCQFLAQFRLIDPPAAANEAAGYVASATDAPPPLSAIKRIWRDLARGPPAGVSAVA